MFENDRFVEFLNYLISTKKVRNQQEFVEEINSDKSTVSLIKNKKIGIPNDLFTKIQKAYPELNLDWLTTGEGEMLKSDVQINDASDSEFLHSNVQQGSNIKYSAISPKTIAENSRNYQEIIKNGQRQIDEFQKMFIIQQEHVGKLIAIIEKLGNNQ
jgi:hypothetical protein